MSKLLKYGLAAIGGSMANAYFNPSKSTLVSPKGTAATATYQFATSGGGVGSNLVGSVMNKLGITPFQGTSLGQSAASAYNKYVPGFVQQGLSNLASGKGLLGTGMGSDMGSDEFGMFAGMNRFPDAGSVQARSIRTDTNFGVSGMGSQIPLGSGNRINRALAKPEVQNFLAGHIRRSKIPNRIMSPQISPGSLASGRVRVKRSATRTKAYTSDKAQTFS